MGELTSPSKGVGGIHTNVLRALEEWERVQSYTRHAQLMKEEGWPDSLRVSQ